MSHFLTSSHNTIDNPMRRNLCCLKLETQLALHSVSMFFPVFFDPTPLINSQQQVITITIRKGHLHPTCKSETFLCNQLHRNKIHTQQLPITVNQRYNINQQLVMFYQTLVSPNLCFNTEILIKQVHL